MIVCTSCELFLLVIWTIVLLVELWALHFFSRPSPPIPAWAKGDAGHGRRRSQHDFLSEWIDPSLLQRRWIRFQTKTTKIFTSCCYSYWLWQPLKYQHIDWIQSAQCLTVASTCNFVSTCNVVSTGKVEITFNVVSTCNVISTCNVCTQLN